MLPSTSVLTKLSANIGASLSASPAFLASAQLFSRRTMAAATSAAFCCAAAGRVTMTRARASITSANEGFRIEFSCMGMQPPSGIELYHWPNCTERTSNGVTLLSDDGCNSGLLLKSCQPGVPHFSPLRREVGPFTTPTEPLATPPQRSEVRLMIEARRSYTPRHRSDRRTFNSLGLYQPVHAFVDER